MMLKSKSSEESQKDGIENYREECPNVGAMLRRRVACNRRTILNRLPILEWLPKYQSNYLFADFVAGLTVGLTAIPQGIAYAVVAGLEPQYGLYAGFMGCFVYMVFGGSKDITIGPTAIMSLMVQRYVTASPDFAVLSAFLSGLIIFLFGLLNLGFLVQFISIPVTAGFTSAAAITIASGQIKSLMGLPGASNEFIESWENVFEHIRETKLWDTILGVSTVTMLLALKSINNSTRWPVLCKYLSLSRNALAVIGGTLLAYLLQVYYGSVPFAITGKVASGLPPFQPPPFSTEINNTTVPFSEMVSGLGSSIIAIPVIAILESIAVAKAFAKGKTINASQEMIALGLCNVVGSFVSSMPITGSFTRTAVNHTSGVRTPLGGIFTGIIVLLALGLLTETFYFIPKTVLAAVILSAMFFMVEIGLLFKLWKTKRMDTIPFMVTLVICLILGLEFGIVAGVATNLIFILYRTARPTTHCEVIKVANQEVLLVTPDQSLFFSSAEYIKYKVMKSATENPTAAVIVINGHYVQHMDSTTASNLRTLVDDLNLLNKTVLFWNWPKQPVGVAFRMNRDFGLLFKSAHSLEDLLSTVATIEPSSVVSQN